MKRHTNFYDEVDYEVAPESWLVQGVWLVPAILLVGWIVVRLFV